MKKKITYKTNPFGDVKIGKRVMLSGVPNLPSLAKLAASEKTKK